MLPVRHDTENIKGRDIVQVQTVRPKGEKKQKENDNCAEPALRL